MGPSTAAGSPTADPPTAAGSPTADPFTARFEPVAGDGPRLAVKCSIDVAGAVTHAGSPALADRPPAPRDAAVVAAARAAGARIVGHTVMPEFGATALGRNPFFGTPANPLDPTRVPGGSSTGSTVAVVVGEADTALGTDAGGSCRIPPACCGAVGLKTTSGRVPITGVVPLAPTLDVVGPIGRDVAGCLLGMQLIEPGFTPAAEVPTRVARARPPADPAIDAAIDRALANAGLEVVEVELDWLDDAYRAGAYLLLAEAHRQHQLLLASAADRISEEVAAKLRFAGGITSEQLAEAVAVQARARRALDAVLADTPVLVLPTIPVEPPPADADLRAEVELSRLTLPFNLTGHPALALPVPREDGGLPASLQLVGPWRGEETLFALAAHIQRALDG